MLVISHAAFSAHVATHSSVDQQSCELCTGQANPSHAIPPSAFVFQSSAGGDSAESVLHVGHSAATLIPFHQRGPPRLA